MKKLALIFVLFFSIKSHAQWPGAFYGFELVDTDGSKVDSSRKDFRLYLDTAAGPKSIRICDDNSMWRLYKGDVYLYVSSFLVIDKISDETDTVRMTLEFPAPLTGGEHKYYANLYLGEIRFSPGVFKIVFPETSGEWDTLKELKLCPDGINFNSYLDISAFQKKGDKE